MSLLGVCDREGCGRPRARNPRNGKIHPYCSLRCSRFESLEHPSAATTDFAMDLVIALEMSRLQLIEDEIRKQNHGHSNSNHHGSQSPSIEGYSEEAQLRLAIHLSLEESRKLVAGKDISSNSQTSASSVDSFAINLPHKQESSLKNYIQPDSEKDSKTSKSLFGNFNSFGVWIDF